jgi:long-chain acyl-CoA synthetase
MSTLRDLLTVQARRLERKIFLEYGERQYSYGGLDDRTDRVATGLNRMGLLPGDRVALLLTNRPEFIFFFLGAPKMGFVPVPLNPDDSASEIEFILEHCGAAAIVTESRFRSLKPGIPKTTCWIEVDDDSFDKPPFQGLTAGSVISFWPDLSADDPAAIIYSRESTGALKTVVLTHKNLLSNYLQLIRPFRMDASDRYLCAVPVWTIEAQVLLILAPLMVGAGCVLRESGSTHLVQDIHDCRATVLAGTPALYEGISGEPDFVRTELSFLRLAVCHSEPARERILTEFQARHDALIVEAYKVTEGTCLCCANPYTGIRKPGSLGLPLPGLKCAILDEQGRELSAGRLGEIGLRGPNVMKEYYKDPERTRNAFRNGWLHTGDFGYIDSDGYYWKVSGE